MALMLPGGWWSLKRSGATGFWSSSHHCRVAWWVSRLAARHIIRRAGHHVGVDTCDKLEHDPAIDHQLAFPRRVRQAPPARCRRILGRWLYSSAAYRPRRRGAARCPGASAPAEAVLLVEKATTLPRSSFSQSAYLVITSRRRSIAVILR